MSIVAIMRAIVDRIGYKLSVLNEDGVYRRDRKPWTKKEAPSQINVEIAPC